MKPNFRYSLGIIGTYIFLLIAILAFDMDITNLFLSFMMEFALMTIAYGVVNTFFKRTLRTKAWTLTILIIGYALINLQLGFLGLIASELGEVSNQEGYINRILDEHSIPVLILMSAVYLLHVFFIYRKTGSLNFVAEDYFKKGFTLYAITTGAVFAVFIFGISKVVVIACLVVAIRIALEFNFNKKEWKDESSW